MRQAKSDKRSQLRSFFGRRSLLLFADFRISYKLQLHLGGADFCRKPQETAEFAETRLSHSVGSFHLLGRQGRNNSGERPPYFLVLNK